MLSCDISFAIGKALSHIKLAKRQGKMNQSLSWLSYSQLCDFYSVALLDIAMYCLTLKELSIVYDQRFLCTQKASRCSQR